jgi:hypothetical protein
VNRRWPRPETLPGLFENEAFVGMLCQDPSLSLKELEALVADIARLSEQRGKPGVVIVRKPNGQCMVCLAGSTWQSLYGWLPQAMPDSRVSLR